MTNTFSAVLAALQAHDVKQIAPDEYQSNSPFRAGSDSQAFTVKRGSDNEHGTYFDFVTGETGSLYELADKLGIELPTLKTVETTKRKYRDLDDYAEAHGVERSVFEAAGWQECQYMDRPALRWVTGNGYFRYRFLDGDEPRFVNQPGIEFCWYGLDRALTIANGQPLVYANGEPSVIVGQYYGVPAISMTGGGERAIPDNLLTELYGKYEGQLLLALEDDNHGRQARQKITAQLNGRTQVVHLGLDGGDLADFCKLHTANAWAELEKRISANPPTPPPLPLDLPALLRDFVKAKRIAQATSDDIDSQRAIIDRMQSALDSMRQDLGLVVQPIAPSDFMPDLRVDIERAIDKPGVITGLSYGLSLVDSVTNGLNHGEVITLLAETGMGKSWFYVSVMANLIKQGKVLCVPTEMSPKEYTRRLAAYMAQVPVTGITRGGYKRTDERYKRFIGALNTIETSGNLVFSPSPRLTDICDMMKRGDYCAVIVDSIDNVIPPQYGGIYDETRMKTKMLQAASKTTGVPHLRSVQIGRKSDESKVYVPRKKDATGAADIENDSDVILALYNPHQHMRETGITWQSVCQQLHFFDGKKNGALLRVLKLRNEEMPDFNSANMVVGYIAGVGFVDYQDAVNYYAKEVKN